MSLSIKSMLIFVLKVLKWSLVFAVVIVIKAILLSQVSGILVLLSETARTICVSFPAVYSVAFVDTLIFLMKNKNDSYIPILTLTIPLFIIVFFLQPFLYSITQGMGSVFGSVETTPIAAFVEPSSDLKEFVKGVCAMLDDLRQEFFEGYSYYLFCALSYVFFLFSLSFLTIKAKWAFFNLLLIFILVRLSVSLYGIMNINDMELYIFSFSTNQLHGIPTYIVMLGFASLLCLYGIVSRLKKVF